MTRRAILPAAGLAAVALAGSVPARAMATSPRAACPSRFQFIAKKAISARTHSHGMVKLGEVYLYRRHKTQGSPAYDFASFCYVIDLTGAGRREQVEGVVQVFNHHVNADGPIDQHSGEVRGRRSVGRTRYNYTPATFKLKLTWFNYPLRKSPVKGGSVRLTAHS